MVQQFGFYWSECSHWRMSNTLLMWTLKPCIPKPQSSRSTLPTGTSVYPNEANLFVIYSFIREHFAFIFSLQHMKVHEVKNNLTTPGNVGGWLKSYRVSNFYMNPNKILLCLWLRNLIFPLVTILFSGRERSCTFSLKNKSIMLVLLSVLWHRIKYAILLGLSSTTRIESLSFLVLGSLNTKYKDISTHGSLKTIWVPCGKTLD